MTEDMRGKCCEPGRYDYLGEDPIPMLRPSDYGHVYPSYTLKDSLLDYLRAAGEIALLGIPATAIAVLMLKLVHLLEQ